MEKEIPQEFWLLRDSVPIKFVLSGESKVLKGKYIYETIYITKRPDDFGFVDEILSLTRLEADLNPQTKEECIDRQIFWHNGKIEALKKLKQNGNK
jgi:hypothetical protein